METRKVIGFGNSSFVISLPKGWLRKYNIKKGYKVYLKENGNGALELTAQFKDEEPVQKKITISCEGKNQERIQREIIASYIKDYNTIEVNGKSINKYEQTIRETVKNKLVAVEVIEQTKDKIVIGGFLDYKTISHEVLIKRMDILVRSIFYDIQRVKEEELSDNIVQRDIDIDRLFFLIQRTIKHFLENVTVPREKTVILLKTWDLAHRLERIADDLKRTGRFLKHIKNEGELLEDIITIVKGLEEDYTKTMKAEYTKDMVLAFNLSYRKGEVGKQCDDLYRRDWNKKWAPLITETLKDISASTHRIARGVYS